MIRTTYARARLWTGITSVGTVVLLACTLLLFRVPARLLPTQPVGPVEEAGWILLVFLVGALATLPFDVRGGLVLPRRHGRPAPDRRTFARSWLRGISVLGALSVCSAMLLVTAGRLGARPAALVVFLAVAALLLHGQETLARWVGGLRRVPGTEPAGVLLLDGDDPAFCGGFTGPRGRLVLPALWARTLDAASLDLIIERRRGIRRTGAWRRSLSLALAANATGFLFCTWLPGAGVQSVAELVTTTLGFTLWTFLGLLLFPLPSRRASLAADALVCDEPQRRERWGQLVCLLDQLQDDEPERSAELESIFHPVPSVYRRLEALEQPDDSSAAPGRGAWHLARTALFLSYAGLSLLPRAVHCNAGRPELWVYLPSDG